MYFQEYLWKYIFFMCSYNRVLSVRFPPHCLIVSFKCMALLIKREIWDEIFKKKKKDLRDGKALDQIYFAIPFMLEFNFLVHVLHFLVF